MACGSVSSRTADAMARRSRGGGKGRPSDNAAADDVHGLGEGDPVRVPVLGRGRRLVNQLAGGVVDDQVSPDLLTCPVRTARTQDGVRPSLMGLQFLEDALDLPALVVQGSQLL